MSSSKINQPVTQEKQGFREGWPAWVKQLPQIRFSKPDETFQLINPQALDELLKKSNADPENVTRIKEDIGFLDHELLRLFRERDYNAKYQQNRYRMYQLMYMVLAAVATVIGSIIALELRSNPGSVPWWAFAETCVALVTTYLASVSGREPPLSLWLENRRRAEALRREYFRFLMNLEPYEGLEAYERRRQLALRAANINRGIFPDSGNRTIG
jgi:hypothetical protein